MDKRAANLHWMRCVFLNGVCGGNVLDSGVGGAIVMAIIGLIKSMMAKH